MTDLTIRLEQATAKVDALKAERDEIAATRTREDAASLAAGFVSNAQRTEVRSYVLSGHAHGDPLQQVLNAYIASGDPRPFPEWATELAQEEFDLSEKQKAAALDKLDAAIETATKEHLAAAKAVRPVFDLPQEEGAAKAVLGGGHVLRVWTLRPPAQRLTTQRPKSLGRRALRGYSYSRSAEI